MNKKKIAQMKRIIMSRKIAKVKDHQKQNLLMMNHQILKIHLDQIFIQLMEESDKNIN